MLNIQLEQILPSQIEHRNFELIQQELDHMGIRLDPENELVIKRAIHITTDFEYADSLVFSNRAVKKGMETLRQGMVIITDTNMGKSGISKRAASALEAKVLCFMTDEDIAREAEGKRCTRAVVNMERAVRLFGVPGGTRPCIFAISNAPTVLIRLYELVKEGWIRPSLIIGVPVGFVNVVQSKELILTLEDTPYIVAKGKKGGGNVAAAIYNVLLCRIKQYYFLPLQQ